MTIRHLVPPGISLAHTPVVRPDPHEYTYLSNLIGSWNFQDPIDVGIVGVPFAHSRKFQGASEAPDAIRESFLQFASRSHDFERDIGDLNVRDVGDVRMHPTDLLRCHANIEECLTDLYRQSPPFVPLVLGGNHAIAAPSIRAFRHGNGYSRLGLVHFDAHNDLGDPSVAGPTSGTMFRQVIDEGHIEGHNAVQVGLHGSLASPRQRDYAQRVGVREIPAREVWNRGIRQVMDEALKRAADGTDAVYASFDIDVIEDASAPGTGVPAPGGLDPKEAIEAMYMLGKHPRVMGLEIVEVDPIKDIRGVTVRLACQLMVAFLVGLYERRHPDG